jgi:hypothetical protein
MMMMMNRVESLSRERRRKEEKQAHSLAPSGNRRTKVFGRHHTFDEGFSLDLGAIDAADGFPDPHPSLLAKRGLELAQWDLPDLAQLTRLGATGDQLADRLA